MSSGSSTHEPLGFDDTLRSTLERRLQAMDRRIEAVGELKRAAVTLTVVPSESSSPQPEASLILTRRALHLKNHRGQFALPGGRIDAGETAVQAALRELEEEVNLHYGQDRVLGRLDDYVTRSGYHLTAVVVWGNGDEPVANPDEVASIHRVSLTEIADPETRQSVEMFPGDPLAFGLAIVDNLVFAPTAAVMFQLANLAVHGTHEPIHHLEEPRFAWK